MALLAALALLNAGCSQSDQPAAPRWPGPENTGVPAGTTLAPLNGETTLLATPGEVVDGKDVTDGSVSGFDPGRPGNVWAGIEWHDSGAPVEP